MLKMKSSLEIGHTKSISYNCRYKHMINPIPTRLCHVICHGDKSYPCLVGGIGLTHNIPKQLLCARMWDEVHTIVFYILEKVCEP